MGAVALPEREPAACPWGAWPEAVGVAPEAGAQAAALPEAEAAAPGQPVVHPAAAMPGAEPTPEWKGEEPGRARRTGLSSRGGA